MLCIISRRGNALYLAPVITTSSPTMTGPTLSTATGLALIIEGTVAFTATGAFGISAYTSSGADTFVIGAGAPP